MRAKFALAIWAMARRLQPRRPPPKASNMPPTRMRAARQRQWRAASRLSSDPAKLRQRRGRAKTRDAADGSGRRGAAAHGRSRQSRDEPRARAVLALRGYKRRGGSRHALHARAKEARADSRDAEGFGGRGPLARRRRGRLRHRRSVPEPGARSTAIFWSCSPGKAGNAVALAISGLWIVHHPTTRLAEAQAASGALNIVWVNHSYHHLTFKSRPTRKPIY